MSLITVVMPMRNAERYVEAAAASVLSQAEVELELIVVDDGSTDRSAAIVRAINDPRVRVVPGPVQGIAAAMNVAVAAARGAVLARCDADDLFPPGRLARQSRLLAGRPEFGAVCGAVSTVTPSGRPLSDWEGGPARELTAELLDGACTTHLCTYAIRAEAVRAAGGFRPYFVTAEDIDFQFRLAERCRIWYEPAVCYLYRLHEQSITHTQPRPERMFFEDAARRLLTQRRGGGQDDLQRGCPASPPPPAAGDSAPTGYREHAQRLLIGASWDQHRAGRRLDAIVTGLRACLARPRSLSAWKSLGALALKPRPRPPAAPGG